MRPKLDRHAKPASAIAARTAARAMDQVGIALRVRGPLSYGVLLVLAAACAPTGPGSPTPIASTRPLRSPGPTLNLAAATTLWGKAAAQLAATNAAASAGISTSATLKQYRTYYATLWSDDRTFDGLLRGVQWPAVAAADINLVLGEDAVEAVLLRDLTIAPDFTSENILGDHWMSIEQQEADLANAVRGDLGLAPLLPGAPSGS
jgi:hypothetical protein